MNKESHSGFRVAFFMSVVCCQLYFLIALCQVCLGGAKLEVEVDADRHVTGIVCDIEAEEFLFLALLFVVEEREDEAMVGLVVVGFPVFLATIDKRLFLHVFACCHGEVDALPHLVVLGIEGTCQGEDGEHVVVAVVALVMMFRPLPMPIQKVLLHMALAVGISVPHFIHGVVLALERTLAEVEGNELRRDVGDEGVAHGEDCIAPLVAGEEQVIAQGWLSLIRGRLDGVEGRAALHPNEFPMEVEVIRQAFTSLESRVLRGTLGAGG